MSIDLSGVLVERPDLDFWYNPIYPNYFNLLNVIEELGVDVSEFKEEVMPDPHKSFFKLDLDSFTADFLPVLPGFEKFKSVYERREIAELGGVSISFIGFDDLIYNKQTTGRAKDIRDVRQLKINRNKR